MGNCFHSCEDVEEFPKANAFTSKDELQNSSLCTARNNMLLTASSRGDVLKYYNVLSVLGEGSMGSVSLVKKRKEFVGGSAYTTTRRGWFGRTVLERVEAPADVLHDGYNKLYALKSIILSRVSEEFLHELRNEISILQNLNHPNIVKAYEVYETSINIYVVLEHCSGGDLYTRAPYSEKDSAKIIGKLLSAIAYMHKHNITHRDLKFENIMFENRLPDAEIKLIDFGLSKKVEGDKKYMTEGVGTIYTMAPQVLRGVYTSQADLWSIGVITYMLLSNTKPFYGKKRNHVVSRILKGVYKFYSHNWEHISEEAKDFVGALIEVDPDIRLNATQALSHKWLSKEFDSSERIPDDILMHSIHENIINYGAVSEFKKLALMVLAHKSSTDEILELRKAFDTFDTEKNGTISLKEFKSAMKKSPNLISDEEVEKLFHSLDVGADGEIYYMEFLAATLEVHGRITEERLAEAFDRIDSDDSGFISKKNLKDFLGKNYSDAKIDQILKEVDFDNDGGINFNEFLKIFRQEQKKDERKLKPMSSHDFGSFNLSDYSGMDLSLSEEELLKDENQ